MTALAASTFVWVFILVPLLIVWVLGLVDIWRRDIPRGTKAAWTIIVLVLPFVGTLLYFLLRKPTEQEITEAREAGQGHRSSWPRGSDPRPPVS